MSVVTSEIDKGSRYKRLRRRLLVSNIIILGLILILYFIPVLIPLTVFVLLVLLFIFNLLVMLWSTRKYYNWTIAFILLIIIAIFFRRMRWPVTAFAFTAGFIGLSINSLVSAFIFLKKYKHNNFLRYIGFSSSIVLAMVSNGLLFKNMHWTYAGILLNIGLVLFIPFLFAFVFTLPGSNYVSWEKPDRLIFFRVVIIPMTFVFVLCVLIFAMPDLWTSITRTMLIPFDMWPTDLISKPGIF